MEQEVESALEHERQKSKTILFPVRLDDAVMTASSGWPRLLRNTRNICDMRARKDHDAYQKAFERLLRDLRAGEAAPGRQVPTADSKNAAQGRSGVDLLS